MKIEDLLSHRNRAIFEDDCFSLRGDLIALDAGDGKILFDTRRNKIEHIEKYRKGEVLDLWADCVLIHSAGYGDYFKPIMKCYVLHDSWEGERNEQIDS